MGWFPLAPGEVYMPYYRGSRGYVERVNVTNTVVNVTRVTNVYNVYNSNQRNVTNITYVNQRVNNGVTLVSRDTFVNARPVQRNLGRFDARQMAMRGSSASVQVQPVRASVLGSGAPAQVQAAAGDRQSPGGCDPKAGAAPAAFRTAAGGECTHRAAQRAAAAAESSGERASGGASATAGAVRWRRNEPLRPTCLVLTRVRSGRLLRRGWPNQRVRKGPRPRVLRRAQPTRTTTAAVRKAGRIPRPSRHRRCSKETQPRPGTMRTSSAPGSNSARRPHRRRIALRRCIRRNSVSRSGSRRTGRSRRSRLVDSVGIASLQTGTGNFFVLPTNHRPHDRLLRTGNLKPGTGSYANPRTIFRRSQRPRRQGERLAQPSRECHAGRCSQPLRADHSPAEGDGIVTRHVRESGIRRTRHPAEARR